MAPDDNLFTEPNPESDPAPEPEVPTDNGTPVGLTADEVQQMIQAGTAQLQTDNLALQTELRTLKAQQPVAETPPVPTADEFIDSFTNDAQGTVQKTAEEIVNKRISTMAPFFEQQNNTMHATLMDAERRAVDAEYGPEAWATHFEPTLQARMADLRQSNAVALSDPSVIKTEVLGVMGLKRNELNDLKLANLKTAGEAKEAEMSELMSQFKMQGMTGGTSAPAVNVSKELSDTEKEYVAAKKSAGIEVDIQKLRAIQSSEDTSFAGYQKLQEAKP